MNKFLLNFVEFATKYCQFLIDEFDYSVLCWLKRIHSHTSTLEHTSGNLYLICIFFFIWSEICVCLSLTNSLRKNTNTHTYTARPRRTDVHSQNIPWTFIRIDVSLIRIFISSMHTHTSS